MLLSLSLLLLLLPLLLLLLLLPAHRVFEEDAATDLVQWLSNFRQQQQTCGPAVIAAAAGSLAAAADLEALSSSVMQVMEKMVSILVTPAAPAPAPATSAVSSTDNNGPRDSVARRTSPGAAASRGNSNTGPLAKREFVMGVLERLNEFLLTLHRALQQQQNLAATPADMWREVQRWMQQLHAQATCAADHTALQLAALL
jgi:hypothetical protein